MALAKTPICNFGEKAKDFNLLSTKNEKLSLKDIKGKNGTLIMFICNHCPYVKAVIKDIVQDVEFLKDLLKILTHFRKCLQLFKISFKINCFKNL